ncbi:hypothetical protein BGZ51_001123 [Haplosporangium sp. Z 767]|nr:hypothetical protein BGZ51_001123 [Haplosporangium sp. Z 767]
MWIPHPSTFPFTFIESDNRPTNRLCVANSTITAKSSSSSSLSISTVVAVMETGGFHEQGLSASSDPDDSFQDTSTSTTTTGLVTPSPSARRYSVAGVIRSLFHAVLVQDTEHLEHVLTSLALDPNKVRDKEQKTMLMVAATENKHHVLRYLLSLPIIDVDLQDDEGETALYQAAAAGSTKCVQLLLLAGASAMQGNEEAITPLIIASYNGFVTISRLLITIGHADVNQQDNTQKSALLLASYAGHVEIMIELIEHGANLNTLDQYGWSALMLAAYAGRLDACKLLLAHGADPHIRTTNGKNARSLSWDAGHKSIAAYISKFLVRDINVSATSSGVGSGMSSRTLIQQILPPAPKSPSRRTHSPAPSLPSVPEEAQEEDNYRIRRSFSGHNSTISRQSGLSARLVSPPKGRRPRSLAISSLQPKFNLEEPMSPLPTATATSTNFAPMFHRDNDVPHEEPPIDDVSSVSLPSARQSSIPAILPSDVPESSALQAEKSRSGIQHHSTESIRVYSVHRHGVVPRYGSKHIHYYSETRTDTEATASKPPTQSVQPPVRLYKQSSNSCSERTKEKDKEKDINQKIRKRLLSMERSRNPAWVTLSHTLTFCCPTRMLPRMWSRDRCQDWREKMAICVLILMLSIVFGLLAFGMALLTCRPHSTMMLSPLGFYARYGSNPSNTASTTDRLSIIQGVVYDVGKFLDDGLHPSIAGINITSMTIDTFLSAYYGTDISFLFTPKDVTNACSLFDPSINFGRCTISGATGDYCHQTQGAKDVLQKFARNEIQVAYEWQDIQRKASGRDLLVYDGSVLDMTDYLNQTREATMTPAEEARMVWIRSLVGKDATMAIRRQPDRRHIAQCLESYFKVGVLSVQTSGCLASIVINTLTLAILVLISLLRLVSALVYRWIAHQPLVEGTKATGSDVRTKGESHVLMLVTCRATDQEQNIKATLQSLALTDYDDSLKVLLVIADGPKDASGEPSEVSQICLGLMDRPTVPGSDKAADIAEGLSVDQLSKGKSTPHQRHSIADSIQVYSGHYVVESRRIPYILAIKRGSCKHPQSNFGHWYKKRLVVQWLYRICFNEPMTVSEYELSERVRGLTGHGPERFEMLLMAEVGTECAEKSLGCMVAALENNERIMGISAQRQVTNRTENWLTRVQDYQNNLTLQLIAAFESTLGAVQCLPSGFSMARIKRTRSSEHYELDIKAAKRNSGDTSIISDTDDAEHEGRAGCKSGESQDAGGSSDSKQAQQRGSKDMDRIQYSVPILLHPSVVSSYSGKKARTLHERNVVMDGAEDRYLTGLLHRTFPGHRIVYLPQATYKSAVTTDFRTYLEMKRIEVTGTFHNAWMQIWPSEDRGAPCSSVSLLALLEWLQLVLSPVLFVALWTLVILVSVGSALNIGALYSLPTILALAFTLSIILLLPLLGLCLGKRPFAAHLYNLLLFLAITPIQSVVIPFKKWAEVFEDPNLTQESLRDRAISQHSNLGVDGIRSVCWKIYLSCLPTLEIPDWSFAMNKERERYVKLRQKYIRAIGGDDGAEPDLEVNNPLSLAEDSPWQQFFVDSELRKIIKQDVERTLPDIDYFRSERVQEQLSDILFIYCKINHDVSYRQGMHELVAHILWVVSSESLDVLAEPGVSSDPILDVIKNVLDSTYVEHDTFILFSSLMTQAKPWYEFSDEGFTSRKPKPPAGKQTPVIEWSQKIFHHLERVDNELYLHLMSLEIQPQLFGIRWFRLLFSREFPMDDVLKIWDGIFAKDPSLNICIFIGLALLLRIRDELLEEDFSGCLHKLMRYPSVKDIHLFIPQALYLQKTPNAAGGQEIIKQNNILTGKPLPELPPSAVETGYEGQRQHHHRQHDGAAYNQNQAQSSHHQHHHHHNHHHHNQQSHSQDQIKGLSSSFPGNGVLSQHLPPAALDAIKPVAEGFVHVTKNMLESKGGAALNKAIHDMKKNTQSYIRKANTSTAPISTPSFPPMFDQAISSSGKLVASSRPAPSPQHHTAHGPDKHIQSQLGQIVAKALVILESEFMPSSKGAQEGTDSGDGSKSTEASPSKSPSKAALAAISGLEHVRDILLGFSKEIDPLVIESGMLENPDSAAGASIAATARSDAAHTGPKPTQATAKQSTHRSGVMSAPINVASSRGSTKAFAHASRGASPARSSLDGLNERRSVSRTSSQVSGIIGGNGHEYGFGTSSTLSAQASSPTGSEPSIYAPAPVPPVTPKPFSFDDLIEGTDSSRSSSPSSSPGTRAGSAGLASKVKSPRSSLANSQFSWILNDSADGGNSTAGLKSTAGGSQPFLSPLPSPSLPKAGFMASSPSESHHLKVDPLAGSVSKRGGSGQSTSKAVPGLSTATAPTNHQLQEDDPLRT